MSPSSLPPYLTSGASSRAHHAFLVRLHSAASEQEEEEIIRDQVRKARQVLVIGQSTSKILDTLIILLHCQVIRHDTSSDLEFALLPALGLAEGGKTIYERRIGYLYLTECLPRDHELRLMLINTVRKDLSSVNPQHTLLALHAIIHMPSHDLEPAVTPLLISKTLLRHANSAVRQRALQTLQVLHLQDDSMSLSRTIGPNTFPLDMRKIIKLLELEEDASVQQCLLKLIGQLVKSGVHRIKDDNERLFLTEQMIGCMADAECGPLTLTGIKALADVLLSGVGNAGEEKSERVFNPVYEWIETILGDMTLPTGWESGLLLEICRLVWRLPQGQTPTTIPGHLVRILTGMLEVPSSGSDPVPPPPNDHVLVLRCLAVLPLSMWAENLSESEMGTIMEGLNHADDTIRRLTLRLLHRLSPDLPHASYSNHLQAIRTSTDLALPLGYSNDDPEAKLRAAQEETASRALEAAEIIFELEEDDVRGGEDLAHAVVEVLEVLSEAQDIEKRRIVWEHGVRLILGVIDSGHPDSQNTIANVLSGHKSGSSATLHVVQATVVSKYCKLSVDETVDVLSVLSRDMTRMTSSVQELVIIAGLVLCGRLPAASRETPLEALQHSLLDLEGGSKYIKKRCKQVNDIIDEGLIDQVVLASGSNPLPEVLQRIITLASRSKPSTDFPVQPLAGPSTSTTTLASSPSLSLRYEPYDLPQSSPRSRLIGSPASPGRGAQPRRPRHRDDFTSAGDFTLFDADADADADADVESVDFGIGTPPSPQDNDPTLVSLSLDESPLPRDPPRPLARDTRSRYSR